MNYLRTPFARTGPLPCQERHSTIRPEKTPGVPQAWRPAASLVGAAGLLMGSGAAEAVVVSFEEYAVNTPLSTAPGWTTTAPDLSPLFPFAWVADSGASKVGAVGGYFEAPLTPAYSATVSTPLPILTDSYYSIVSFDMAIIDSTNSYASRDKFGFSVNDSTGSPTVAVEFRPIAQTTTPASLIGLWEVVYTVRGGVAVNTTVSLAESSAYSFQVAYQATGITLSFGSPALENVFSAIPTGYAPTSQSITGVSYNWVKSTGTPAYGDNYIIFDNVAVAVPEPMTALVTAGAGLALLFRRRRESSVGHAA